MKNKYWVAGLCLLVLMLCLVSACGGGASSTLPGSTTAASISPSSSPSPSTNPSPSTAPIQTTTTTSTTPSGGAGGSVSDILGKGANIASVYYEMTITSAGQVVNAKVWQKQQKMKEEITMEGESTVMIFDMAKRIMYTYMPSQGMAIKMTLNESQIPQGSTEENNAILDYNPAVIGTEIIDGKSCTVIIWEVSGSETIKEWVWTEKGFPLKWEGNVNGETTTIEYTNIDFSDIPDSTFELPKDVQIISQ